MSLLYFLEEALGKELQRGYRDISSHNYNIQGATVEFSLTMYYSGWARDYTSSDIEEKFPNILSEVKLKYHDIIKTLGLELSSRPTSQPSQQAASNGHYLGQNSPNNTGGI